MSTLVTIASSDVIANSRTDINNNFSALNTDKIETSTLDTDTALTANSDNKIATQKAVKAYVDSGGNQNASTTARGLVEEATSAEIIAGTGTGGTGARLFVNPTQVAETGADKIVKIKSTGLLDSSILPPSSVATQEIPLMAGATVYTNIKTTSDTTGSVLFTGIYVSGTLNLFRLAKDSSTGNYYVTHTTSFSFSGGQSFNGLAVLGNYLYFIGSTGGANITRRYDKADLANVTTITVSGTDDRGNGNVMWSDGTQLYVYSSASTWRIYTVSGTVMTAGSTVGFTSAGTDGAAICNGTNVWITDDSGGDLINIRKYPIAGGAVTSTTSPIIYWATYPNAVGTALFLNGTSTLSLVWMHTIQSATAVTGMVMKIMPITLP